MIHSASRRNDELVNICVDSGVTLLSQPSSQRSLSADVANDIDRTTERRQIATISVAEVRGAHANRVVDAGSAETHLPATGRAREIGSNGEIPFITSSTGQ